MKEKEVENFKKKNYKFKNILKQKIKKKIKKGKGL